MAQLTTKIKNLSSLWGEKKISLVHQYQIYGMNWPQSFTVKHYVLNLQEMDAQRGLEGYGRFILVYLFLFFIMFCSMVVNRLVSSLCIQYHNCLVLQWSYDVLFRVKFIFACSCAEDLLVYVKALEDCLHRIPPNSFSKV